MQQIVIAGGGQGGYQAAASLRQSGFEGRIALVSGEDKLPYQRPPLSKAYLKTRAGPETLLLRPEAFYAANRIDLIASEEVVAIDRARGRVALASGSSLAFDHLVLAIGASNRRLPIEGAGLPGVHLLRTVGEAEELRRSLEEASRLVVIGGGFIGLEVAATACARGLEVVVVEAADRLMGRAVSPALSRFFLEAHRAMGVTVELGTAARRILGTRRAEGVEAVDGRRFGGDLVLMATGIVPNTDLARAAGLAVADEILADDQLRTADPRIFAIGDCAACPNRHAPGIVRLELVQNAVDQAKCVAEAIVGRPRIYNAVPWFWSDQGDYKLQIAGLTAFADEVHVAASPEEGRITAYCCRNGRLIGIETVNRPADHMLGRKLLAQDAIVSSDEVQRSDFDLRSRLATGNGRGAPA